MFSYSFRDILMYSKEVYHYLFQAYGETFWYVQGLNFLLGVFLAILVGRPSWLAEKIRGYKDRLASLILFYLWIWVALAFHLKFFLPINHAAYGFAIVFGLQGAIVLLVGVGAGKIRFGPPGEGRDQRRAGWQKGVGLALFLFSLLVVPVLQKVTFGHFLFFGWSAEATALGTLGLALLIRGRWLAYFLIILPVIYSIYAILRAREFKMIEQYWLAGGVVLVLVCQILSHYSSNPNNS